MEWKHTDSQVKKKLRMQRLVKVMLAMFWDMKKNPSLLIYSKKELL